MRFTTRWLHGLQASVLFLGMSASATNAQTVAPPALLPVQTTQPAEQPIEIYYGTRKITPTPLPPAPPVEPIVPASAKFGPVVREGSQQAEAFTEALQNFNRNTKLVSLAALNWFGKMSARAAAPPERQTIILTTHATAPSEPRLSSPEYSAPWLKTVVPPAVPQATPAPAQAQTPTNPTVIVVREPAAVAPAPVEAPQTVSLKVEWLVGLGVGSLLLILTVVLLLRRPRKDDLQTMMMNQVLAGPKLLDKFSIGEMPKTAQRFDIGPSYAEQKQHHEQQAEANANAVVEQILQQNLALLGELQPEQLVETPQTVAVEHEPVSPPPSVQPVAPISLEPFHFTIPTTAPRPA